MHQPRELTHLLPEGESPGIASAVEFSQTSTLDCARCGPVVVTVPIIIAYSASVGRQLIAAIEDGTIQRTRCPRCEQPLETVDAPLLIYHPGPPLHVLFASAQRTTTQQNVTHARHLLARLGYIIGAQAPTPEEVLPGIPRQLLPIVLTEGSEVASQRLLEFVRQFIFSTSLFDAHQIAQEHPELMHDLTLLLLADWRDSEREQGHARNAVTMEERRAFLCRCREVGIDNAFAEKLGCPVSELSNRLIANHIKVASEAMESYQKTEHGQALDRAVASWRLVMARIEAMTLPPEIRLDISNAAHSALMRRYQVRGQPNDLEQALVWSRRAMVETPTDSPERPFYLNNLGSALFARYERDGSLDDLEQAMAAFSQAARMVGKDSPVLSSVVCNLGCAAMARYEWTGSMDDLEQAICAFHQLLLALPMDAPGRPVYLNNLGSVLSYRHDQTGSLDDLQQAIDAFRQAVFLSPEDCVDSAERVFNLGIGLKKRYRRTGRLDDLDQAIECFRRSFPIIPEGTPNYRKGLSSLGSALVVQAERTGRMDVLQEAITTCRRAVALTPEVHPDWPKHVNQLGVALSGRYERTGCLDDLEEAIMCYRQAARVTDENGQGRPGYLDNLGNALHKRYQRTAQQSDMEEACRAFAGAIHGGLRCDPFVVLTSGRSWGDWCLEQRTWGEAAQAYAQGIVAAEQLYRSQYLRADRESWLREVQGMHARAAYCQARMGALREAVETWESGRARMLAEALERDRVDPERVRWKSPNAWAHYDYARQNLHRLRATETEVPGISVDPEELRSKLRAAEAELEAALAEIRSLDGCERLLASPTFADLELRVEVGVPVLYVTATPAGGLVLGIYKDESGVTILQRWLDSLTEATVRELALGPGAPHATGGWFGAYERWHKHPADRATMASWHDTLEHTTRQLWDLLMGPILDFLPSLVPHARDQVPIREAVLIPTGLLALLPLHAAWTDEPTRRWAMDEVTWRYAPSLRVLAHAHEVARHCSADRLLAVDEPGPLADAPLPNSQHEVSAAVRAFAESEVLRHEQCSREAVLDAITRADVCHFSCHGMNHSQQPLYGCLVMAGHDVLTAAHLLGLPALRARMAVLSACDTGLIGNRLPDEVVSLPTTFLQAGFAGVVAPLWSVYDISTSLLMTRFYALWRRQLMAPARALQVAQIWLRELRNRELVEYLEQMVPTLVPKMHGDSAELWHFRALVQDPEARPFASPVYWAAFTLTGV